MRQIGTQSAKYFRRFVTAMLVVAMVITSLTVSSVDSQAAKKVKKVTIGVKVGGSGILVLKKGQSKKLKVSVTPKKASKKVTYKSSKASVVSVSSKGVVKARKSKGSAKITVTSKQNPKKKATIKVKIGTPVKKVAISKNATAKWQSANSVIVERNGQKVKINPEYSEKLQATKNTFTLMNGRKLDIKASVSPKNATRKTLKWSTNKGSVLKVIGKGTKATVMARKVGKANVIAQATDGSGKKAVVKITVTKFVSDKTPAPTATPDSRIKTVIDNFEGYEAGTTWDKFTAAGKLNADGSSTSGTMTVVTDPENAENKCLQIKYTGPDAYDYSPVFTVDLATLKDSLGNSAAGKTLKNYTGIKLNARVVGTSGDVTYKQIYCYFDQSGKISKNDKFAANANKSNSAHVDASGNPVTAGAANQDASLRFGVSIPMAEGSDAKTAGTLFNGNASCEINKYFPSYWGTWKPDDDTTHYTASSCSVGFKAKEADGTVGFAERSLSFNTARINEADNTLLDQSKFDVVLGSTYGGSSKNTGGTDVTLYLDDIALVEEPVPITDFALSIPEGKDVVYPGGDTTVGVTYTPADTTQKELTWTTNNEKAAVDTEGKVTIAEDFELANNETTEVVVTATSKANPALTKSVTIKVIPVELPTEPYVVDLESTYDAELSNAAKPEKTTDQNGVECWKFTFTDKNQRIYFKLPEEVNLSAYQKYELTGYTEKQITLDFWDATLPEQIAKNKADDSYQWYRSWAANTTPFFDGSDPNRMADGTFVGPWGIETESSLLSKIKSTQASDAPDVAPGDYNKVKYVAIGNACNSDTTGDAREFLIYSLKFTPRPQGAQPEFTFTTVPLSESFEGDTNGILKVDNSKVVEGDAQDGSKYMEVASTDAATFLFDNREGTEEVKYKVSAYVKAKDITAAGKVRFAATKTFTDAAYEKYVGYENVTSAKNCMSNVKDLTKDEGWVLVSANVRVAAGTIGEVSLTRDGSDKFEYLLDTVSVKQN